MDQLLEAYIGSLGPDGVSALPADELRDLTQRYPSFAAPAISLLRHPDAALSTDERRRLQAIVALNARDCRSKAFLSSLDGALFAAFYPSGQHPGTPTTDDAITAFLETYGHSSAEEDALLEQMIFNPVADYGAVLAREDESTPEAASDPAASIAAFMEAFTEPSDPSEPPESSGSPQPSESSLPPPPTGSLSESLAKIYIKQRRYDKAYEIISHLCLKNPKKSVYFADQLRFLRKLMLNSKFNKPSNH